MLKTVIFSLLFSKCLSLECYSCSSQMDLHNGMKNECYYFSPSDKTKITECAFPNVCAKYVVQHNGAKWEHRSCRHSEICTEVSNKYNNNIDTLLDCATCSDQDLCNGGNKLFYAFYVQIAILIFFIWIRL